MLTGEEDYMDKDAQSQARARDITSYQETADALPFRSYLCRGHN